MIPDYQSFMLPLLKLLGDGREYSFSDACESLADQFKLTAEEREQQNPSGLALTYVNRIGWARFHLLKAALLQSPRRSVMKITPAGSTLLMQDLKTLTTKDLKRFEAFRSYKPTTERGSDKAEAESQESEIAATPLESPDEAIFRLHRELDSALRLELLTRIKSVPPSFFEKLVVELMLKMGYGGSREDAGQVVGKSGDGGIDGVIKQDRLGLDTIYLQAKRWEGSVGRPDVQAFVGSLAGHRAKRGVFITTSSYSKQALDYVTSIEARVVLIDGEQLATLMIEHDLGVSPIATYVVKRVDGDYFEW